MDYGVILSLWYFPVFSVKYLICSAFSANEWSPWVISRADAECIAIATCFTESGYLTMSSHYLGATGLRKHNSTNKLRSNNWLNINKNYIEGMKQLHKLTSEKTLIQFFPQQIVPKIININNIMACIQMLSRFKV